VGHRLGMPRSAQLCAWADCREHTAHAGFGKRRPVDASLDDVLLKPLPHSAVLCDRHGLAWRRLRQSSPSTAVAAHSPSTDRVDALVAAAAAAATSSSSLSQHASSSPSSPSSSSSSSSSSQPQPPTPVSPPPAAAAPHAAPPRRALSDIGNITPRRGAVRRLSTTLKAKRQLLRTVSAAQTAAERQAVLLRLDITESRVAEVAAVIAANDTRPAEQRAPLTARRLRGGGRKRCLTDEQEKQVEKWVMDKRTCPARLAVAELDIQMEARAEFKAVNGCKAGNTWVAAFMMRRRLSMRVSTTNKELSTLPMLTIRFNYRSMFAELFFLTPGHLLYNMDETSVYLDMPAGRTVERTGARSVEIGTTKHERDRVAVVLCVSRAGTMVTPLLIFRCNEKTQFKKTNRLDRVRVNVAGGGVDLVVTHNKKAWLTGALMVHWLTQIYKPAVERAAGGAVAAAGGAAAAKAMLFMDNCSTHDCEASVTAMRGAAINYKFFPPHCTPILQPCDQNVNQLFKKVYSQQWSAWYEQVGRFGKTAAGNLKKATEEEVTGWIAHAVAAITPNIINVSWERSATARYGLMHLPNAAWSMVLSYFSAHIDVREDWWTMFKRCRLRYAAWQTFTFPETKKRTQKAAVTVAAAAASAPAPAVSMQPQSLPLRLHPMMQLMR
jgi:hypothetical protein